MPIDIYAEKGRMPCEVVVIAAKLLNIDFNVKYVNENNELRNELLEFNPTNSLPTIVDDGYILWDSRAILQYLCNQYSPDSELYPKDPKKRGVVDRWLNFDLYFADSQREDKWMENVDTQVKKDKVKELQNKFKILNQMIGDNKYLTGDELTIADLSIFSMVFYFRLNFDMFCYPNFLKWVGNLFKVFIQAI